MSLIRSALDNAISYIKKEDFEIDRDIPLSYIFSFFIQRCLSLIYGMITLHTCTPIYRYRKTRIKCKSKLKFGANSSISCGCLIDGLSKYGIKTGKNVSFGLNTTMMASGSLQEIGKGITIGDNVGLGTHGFYGGAGGLEIGNDTIFGNYVSVHPENHNYSKKDVPIRLQGVNHRGIVIGDNCWIGAKVTILDGTVIGSGCIVAAGAVVRGIFPNNVIIGGIPAKIIKERFPSEKSGR